MLRKLFGLGLVVILLALVWPARAQDVPDDEVMLPWTVAGNTRDVLQLAQDIQQAALTLDYIDHAEFEWFDPPLLPYRHAVVRIYVPVEHEALAVDGAIMWRLAERFPARWGHLVPYLPPEHRAG